VINIDESDIIIFVLNKLILEDKLCENLLNF